ncbi:MAG: DUF58 domain-containing protein [Planctomycetota bacterium]
MSARPGAGPRSAPKPGRADETTPEELSELLDEVRRIQAQSRRLVTGVLAGGYSSVFRGSGIEVHEVREYAEGDDPRSIDWSVTARLGRPFVKEYVEERDLCLAFLLDLSPSMGGGRSQWSPRRMAARICACIGLAAIENDDKVGLIAFDSEVVRYVPPRKGLRHALRIVRDCLALRGDGRATDLSRPLDYASRAVRRHSVLFLVSDFIADGWQRSMRLCARHHDLVAVRLLSHELELGEGRGMVRMRDPEGGRVVVVDRGSPRVREAWHRHVEAWKQRTAEDVKRSGAELMDVEALPAPGPRRGRAPDPRVLPPARAPGLRR